MTLYHGTNLDIQSIDLTLCRPYKDFGKGFYTTELLEQAQKMANCNLDCKYDIVSGPIADDDMTVLFRQYQNGMLSLDMLLNGMTYKKTTSQYSFHTERAIKFLKKVGVLS